MPSFPLGRTVATPGALSVLEDSAVTSLDLLQRHASGDWGDICDEDAQANEAALEGGLRLMSVYKEGLSEPLWVITEADRSSTTILRPEEY